MAARARKSAREGTADYKIGGASTQPMEMQCLPACLPPTESYLPQIESGTAWIMPQVSVRTMNAFEY